MDIFSRIQNPDIIRTEYLHYLSPVLGRFIAKPASAASSQYSCSAQVSYHFILSINAPLRRPRKVSYSTMR